MGSVCAKPKPNDEMGLAAPPKMATGTKKKYGPHDVTVGYWKSRGMGAAVRMQLEYMGIKYNIKEYEVDEPDASGKYGPNSRHQWNDEKKAGTAGGAFPNLPWVEDGSVIVTETPAIHDYLAARYMPALLGDTPEIRAKVNQLAGVIVAFRWDCMWPCYGAKGKKPDGPDVENEIASKMPRIVAALGDKKFLTGD